VVHGDDVQGLDLKAHQVYEADAGLDMGAGELIAANAYINAQPIVQAMKAGAQVVVTGRTGDPSLTLAPLIHYFNWSLTDWQRLAVGATAGHLLECGAQITGGYFYDPGYKDVPDPANIGFPIAEVHEDGSLFITKALRTGGMVTPETVKEQLLYEIHDPANYITPDVTLDFSQVTIEPAGPDRVQVLGVRGKPAPATVKVTVCFDGGWLGEGEISYAGPNCVARARKAAEVLRQRVAMRQLPVQLRLDLIGLSSVHDGNDGQLSQASTASPQDVRVRLAASGALQDDADQAAREVLALYCCGPAGGGGVRWRTTQRIRTQSYLIDPGLLQTGFTLQGAAELTA
jgi:hypothetical protein